MIVLGNLTKKTIIKSQWHPNNEMVVCVLYQDHYQDYILEAYDVSYNVDKPFFSKKVFQELKGSNQQIPKIVDFCFLASEFADEIVMGEDLGFLSILLLSDNGQIYCIGPVFYPETSIRIKQLEIIKKNFLR